MNNTCCEFFAADTKRAAREEVREMSVQLSADLQKFVAAHSLSETKLQENNKSGSESRDAARPLDAGNVQGLLCSLPRHILSMERPYYHWAIVLIVDSRLFEVPCVSVQYSQQRPGEMSALPQGVFRRSGFRQGTRHRFHYIGDHCADSRYRCYGQYIIELFIKLCIELLIKFFFINLSI